MLWVLWDILIPLISSFGLGILLGWLLWRWRRQLIQNHVAVSMDSESQSESVEGDYDEGGNNSALSELEAANITLIGERDQACDSLEALRSEADALKARCAELEAQALVEDELTVAAASENSNTSVLTEPLKLVTETTEREELVQLKESVENLTSSLDLERKEKRALELELLNRQNRCEKLEAELQAESVSGTDDLSQAQEWEQKYNDSLQQSESLQLKLQESRRELGELKATHLSNVATPVQASAAIDQEEDQMVEKPSASVAPMQTDTSTGIDHGSVEQTAVKEKSADYSESSPPSDSHSDIASVYVPSGWSVPSNVPDKKERDKLTDIKGIGPVLEKMLHESGIYYYRQIALLDKSGVEELQLQIPQFPGRIRRDNWVNQAKKLHASKYGAAAGVSLV